jgi:hypothetical protein
MSERALGRWPVRVRAAAARCHQRLRCVGSRRGQGLSRGLTRDSELVLGPVRSLGGWDEGAT